MGTPRPPARPKRPRAGPQDKQPSRPTDGDAHPKNPKLPGPAATADRGARQPGTRDPGRTSAAILAAAVAEFSEKGMGGARIDAIAERAGINKRMLYHYFGDKDALYASALREIYRGIRTAEQGLGLERLEPVEGIRRLATFTWRYFLDHPEFLGLLATENLNRGAVLRREPWSSDVNSTLVDDLADLLRRGEAQGLFRAGVDPADLYVTMTGIGYFALCNRHTLAVSFGRDFAAPGRADRWGEHMAEVTLAWLTSGAPVPAGGGRARRL